MKAAGASYLGIILRWCALDVYQINDAKEGRFTKEPKNRIPNAIPQFSVGYEIGLK